jgi:pilus assembly protein Flp/PilA
MQILRTLWSDDSGQDMIEYALIAGLISVVAYLAISATGTSINNLWSTINSDVTQATT